MLLFIKKHLITVAGILTGGFAGHMYWWQVGCASGTCPITSSPFWSSVYGALMGGLLFSMFQNKKIKAK